MSATRQFQRNGHDKRERDRRMVGLRAAAVAQTLFDGAPPTHAAAKIRVAIGLQFIRLCEKAGFKDLDRALHQVRVGYVSYVEEKDGPSEFMRWFKQVIEQRALEEAFVDVLEGVGLGDDKKDDP